MTAHIAAQLTATRKTMTIALAYMSSADMLPIELMVIVFGVAGAALVLVAAGLAYDKWKKDKQ